jgi:hypothetical protein
VQVTARGGGPAKGGWSGGGGGHWPRSAPWPGRGRWLAATVLRLRARTPAGWLEGVHRVATRPAPGAPVLTRLPAGWWTASPLVLVRRLGLRLELDLRDNLQRVLYATGTHEPA